MTTRKTSYALSAICALLPTFVYAAQDAPTDPQIVGIALAANKLDIANGKMALAKSKNPKVREFARDMVKDHTAVLNAVQKLAKKLHVKGASSPTLVTIAKGGAVATRKLKSLSGKAFDKFYVDNEVSYHQLVVDAVGGTLIPNAKNAELKAALQGAAPIFEAHLKHAQMLQSSMSNGMSMNNGKMH